MDKRRVPAGSFKQHCLRILDEVEGGEEVVITKRGRPVARLMPMKSARDREADILDKLRRAGGRVLVSEEELLQPSTEMAGWELGDGDEP